jgi:ankyrin repeat protein
MTAAAKRMRDAILSGDSSAVGQLLKMKKKFDLESTLPDNNLSALAFAALRGESAIVEMLLKGGADVDATDNEGCTAFFIASGEGHDDVLAVLQSHDAVINVRDYIGRSAFRVAAESVFLHTGNQVDQGGRGDGRRRFEPCRVAEHRDSAGHCRPRCRGE